MPKPISRWSNFKPQASRALQGLAVIFDLGGFSEFFNQPDVHTYIPKYLNHVTRCVEVMLFGGETSWAKSKFKKIAPLMPLPIHRKFLGDGMLYLWTPPAGKDTFTNDFASLLLNRLWNIQLELADINKACADDVPVFELPTHMRFGVASGTIYELSVEGSNSREYIGICINLASRLQKYCAGLNFIASARLGLPEKELGKHGYAKVLATKIKGFPKEIVIVDKNEFGRLDEMIRKELFASLP